MYFKDVKFFVKKVEKNRWNSPSYVYLDSMNPSKPMYNAYPQNMLSNATGGRKWMNNGTVESFEKNDVINLFNTFYVLSGDHRSQGGFAYKIALEFPEYYRFSERESPLL